MGRAFQRRDLTFGVPAEPDRQDMVMHSAISLMADLCSMWLMTMGKQSGAFDGFALEFEPFNAESNSDS